MEFRAMASISTPVESGHSSAAPKSRRPSLPAVGLIVVVAALLVGAGVLVGRAGDSTTAAKTTTPGATAGAKAAAPSDVSAVLSAFSYPKAWTSETLTGADQQVGIALRLKRTGPDGSFIARRLDGKLAQPFEMAPLASTTEQGLKDAIKDFKLVRTEQLRAGSQDYLRITYLQTQQPSAFTNQLVVVPTADRTFFLTFRSAEADWAKVDLDAQQMAGSFIDAL
jgi:hypothetical protein